MPNQNQKGSRQGGRGQDSTKNTERDQNPPRRNSGGQTPNRPNTEQPKSK